MKRWAAALALLVGLTAEGQPLTGGVLGQGAGSSVPAPSLPDAGKVPAVNAGGTAYELVAAAGTGTVTSVGITAPSIFSVADSPVTASGAIAITLATQAANLVWAGPATGADAAPTFRALVAADLGNFTLAPSLKLLTLQDATGDTTPLTVRASEAPGTAPIAQFQASDNSPLSHIDHDGVWNGDVIGDVTGDVSGTAANVTGTVAVANGGTGLTTLGTALQVLRVNAGETGLEYGTVSGGGITNSAGENVLPKSDGTNLVASSISDTGSAITVGTASGTPQAFTYKLAADGTGTNIAGATATLIPGVGTGTGAASRLLLGGPVLGSTGSAAQTVVTPVSIGGAVKADGTESFLNVTGTLPASPSAAVYGAQVLVTGAGNAAQEQYATWVQMPAGYTGAKRTAALVAYNLSAGTGAASATGGDMNAGALGIAGGSTAGHNVGVYGRSIAGTTLSAGVYGNATSGTRRYGVVGLASTGAGASARVGGWFGHGTAGPLLTEGITAALVADTGSSGESIFLGRDNGTTVFSINDGGGVNLMREVEANTAGSGAPNALAATESNSVMTNEGATAANYHTLPTAAKGLTYTFVVQDSDGLRVTANTDDTIRVIDKVTAAAGYISSTTIGSVVTLLAINAVEWVALSIHGTWTDGTWTYDDTSLTTP